MEDGGSAALEAALSALRHRDYSANELVRRLSARGFTDEEQVDAVERLERTGLLDDLRFARSRAEALARRGAGDALVRHELASAGIAREVLEEALEGLEPELERARRIVEARGVSPKVGRYLAGKGFDEETVAACLHD